LAFHPGRSACGIAGNLREQFMKTYRWIHLGVAVAALAAVGAGAAKAGDFETAAKYAYVMDANTGAVLLDKDGEQRMPPASMSKMMLEYVVFSMLQEGRIKLTDTLPVSEKAWRTGGSKMFVPLGGRVSINDLLQGVIVQSGNDACIVLAEGLAGSEQAFVDIENRYVQKLGLTGSHFADVTGLPNPDHYMTARDLAVLAKHLITDFPEYYHYDSQKEFTYNGIKQGNRNPLLYRDVGADGLKTGHTDQSGYSLTASAVREGRRIIEVLSGMPSAQARADEGERVLDWAFATTADYSLFKAGDKVDEAEVFMGQQPRVPLTVKDDLVITLPRASRSGMKVVLSYDGPLKAPVAKGQSVGTLTITAPSVPAMVVPVVAAADDAPLHGFGRLGEELGYFLWGKRRGSNQPAS
jgi:D-alanyl-D-alanine carboxypeptidase (penicillin-binding protein 5/6)